MEGQGLLFFRPPVHSGVDSHSGGPFLSPEDAESHPFCVGLWGAMVVQVSEVSGDRRTLLRRNSSGHRGLWAYAIPEDSGKERGVVPGEDLRGAA